MASPLPSQDAWTRAKCRYMEDLTQEEKKLYMQATPETILYDASAAEKRHEASSTSRGLMHKLQPFVAAIEQYGQALDVYSNAYPLALSPLWGSVRVLLMIAREFGKYFEKLVDMLARIGDILPRFQVYEKLFRNHERLVHALSVAYVDVIVFCSDAKAVFRRGKRGSLTSFKVGFKLLWKPFESQFGQQLDDFRNHRNNVEKEAGLSHMVEAADARALALANHLQLEKTMKENEYRRIIAMIQSVDVQAKHRKLQGLRFHGTGDWVLQDDKYLEWRHASSPSSLCCYGIPGSGKSVLASRIIDDISTTATSSKVAIVYYYCDYADQRTLQTDRILGTLLKQLLAEDDIPQDIEPQILRAYGDGQRTPGTHEIEDLVCSLMQLHPLAYVVLDGLDECDKQPRRDILNFLKRLSMLGKATVRTFVSCRDEDQLLRSLHSYPRIQLTAAALEADIKSFVEESVRSRIESGQLKIRDPGLEHQISRELVNKAHGMFLWIFFQLDDLCEAPSDAMIRQTLRDLPVGLVQTYERILLKISNSSFLKQEIALRAFRWTVCSRRPMKAEELQEAVAFGSSDSSWDRDQIPDADLMIETCRGLLVRDEEDTTVRFAHHTVHQYLLSAPVVRDQEGSRFPVSNRSEAEAFVGRVCVTYLCFSDFETQVALRTPKAHLEPVGVLKTGGPARIPTVLGIGKSWLEIPYRLLGGKSNAAPLDIDYSRYLTPNTQRKPQAPSTLTEKYRLLEYIVEHWIDHTRELEPAVDAKLRRLVMYKTLSFEFRPWGPNQHFGPHGCVSCPDPTKAKDLPLMSLFHYAAHVGHWSLMESLVAEYCQHELPFDETFLIACRQGQDHIVQNLMRRINYDISDGRAISVAAAAGHADVFKYLLDLSGNAAMEGEIFSFYDVMANAASLLNLAATNGHDKVVDIILHYCNRKETAVYINEKDDRTGRTAFFSAVMSGHENIVRKLLARGAKLTAHGNTALHIAAEYGRQRILSTLFECADEEENIDYDSETGIEYGNGTNETYPQVLLLYFDIEGDTPLHKAARNGHSAVVELILKHQPSTIELITTDIYRYETVRPGEAYTPLHLAAKCGHLDTVQLLVYHGARIKAETHGRERTALHLAVDEGHEAVVEWLLQNGANRNVPAGDGISKPLEVAIERGHGGMVRAFLNSGYKKWSFDATRLTGLVVLAAKNGRPDVLRTVLDFIGVCEEGHFKEVLQLAKHADSQRVLELINGIKGVEPFEERSSQTSNISTTSNEA